MLPQRLGRTTFKPEKLSIAEALQAKFISRTGRNSFPEQDEIQCQDGSKFSSRTGRNSAPENDRNPALAADGVGRGGDSSSGGDIQFQEGGNSTPGRGETHAHTHKHTENR